MKAIILAAGMAKRFGEYIGSNPKCMLEVGGIPIIERQVELLRSKGIKDIVIVKGHSADKINIPDTRYYINHEYDSTNMVASLFCASNELVGDVLISYADILYDEQTLSTVLSAPDYKIGVAVDTEWKQYYCERFSDPYIEAESLVFGDSLQILDIGAANPNPQMIQGQYIGLLRLNKEGSSIFKDVYNKASLSFMNKRWIRDRWFKQMYMTDYLQALIDQDVLIHGIPIKNGWLEFDTVSDYKKVLNWYTSGTIDKFCRIVRCNSQLSA